MSRGVPIILVCGVSATGKSWLCRQLTNQYNYIPHDRCWWHPSKEPLLGLDPKWEKGAISTHFETISNAADESLLPVLTEVPFGERELKDRLEASGFNVICVFVVADSLSLQDRYLLREGKPLAQSSITRNNRIPERAEAWGCFVGNSDQVLDHLKELMEGVVT